MAIRGNYGYGYSFGYDLTPWVKRIIIANVVLFLITIAFPPTEHWLAFVPDLALVRPWGALTYMFVHAGFFHLFFNMLVLFFFGPPLEGMWGGREFLKFYLVAGLGGAAASFLFAPQIGVIGASAAVYGVMLAFAMNWPNMTIHIWAIFPVKAKWLVAFLAALSIASIIGGAGRGVAHFAHLGGFVAAWLYLRFDDRLTDRVSRLKKFVSRRRMQVSPGGTEKAPDPEARRGRKAPRREEDRVFDEVDRVLDKISASGLQSLSDEERRLLDDVSKRYRQN